MNAKEADIVGKNDYDLVPQHIANQRRKQDLEAIAANHPIILEDNLTYLSDGHEETLEIINTAIHDDNNKLIGVLGIARNITERKQTEKELRTLSHAIEQNPVAILITTPRGKVIHANRAFERITGYSVNDVLGRTPLFLKSDSSNKSLKKKMWSTILAGNVWEGNLHYSKKDGSGFWAHIHITPVIDTEKQVSHYLIMGEDITTEKEQEEKILYQAHYDNLTTLPNRFLAQDRLSQSIKEAQRKGTKTAILFLDLDDFKKINDSLGHDIGDKLLRRAAERLTQTVRNEDTVARLGGDEFIIILGDISNSDDIKPIAINLLDQFRKPFHIDGRELVLTTSIGIVIFPDDGDTPDILLRNADIAMYKSKQEGRNTYSFFSDSMNQGISRRLEVEEQLRDALGKSEFTVFYQPLFDIQTKKIIGTEALLRWNNDTLGTITPDEFIPIAEQTGLIHDIGEYVLHEVVSKVMRWRKTYTDNFKVAINVSPRQFRDDSFTRLISSVIQDGTLNPAALELEITEGVLLSGHINIDKKLKSLHDMGVGIAMDDFGTGYSSLSYLRSYPFSVLKIDRSFIADITDDRADFELVNAIISMAHGLGLKVVAEGVETAEQMDLLTSLDCDFVQGYLLGRPSSPDVIENILIEHYSQPFSPNIRNA